MSSPPKINPNLKRSEFENQENIKQEEKKVKKDSFNPTNFTFTPLDTKAIVTSVVETVEETKVNVNKQEESEEILKKEDEEMPKGNIDFKDIFSKIKDCFQIEKQQKDFLNISEINNFCLEKALERLSKNDYIKTDEIIKIYNLLFETHLGSINRKFIDLPVEIENLHPAYIFYSLYDCLEALKEFPNFNACLTHREKVVNENKLLGAYIQSNMRIREILEQKPDFAECIKIFSKLPILTAVDLFGGISHIHPTYVLKDSSLKPQWIFKPTMESYKQKDYELDANAPFRLSQAEHLSYLLNFHHQFPIPATFLVEFKGYIGSMQLLIPHAVHLDTPIETLPTIDLQKLLIFDLLFYNADRHVNNFLFQKSSSKVYGIDHGNCFFSIDVDALKVEYLSFFKDYVCFSPDLAVLVSSENIGKYQKIIEEYLDEPESEETEKIIGWMNKMAKILRDAFRENTRINAFINGIKKGIESEGESEGERFS